MWCNRALQDCKHPEVNIPIDVVSPACSRGLWILSLLLLWPWLVDVGTLPLRVCNAASCAILQFGALCSSYQRHRVRVTPPTTIHLEVGPQPQHGSCSRRHHVAVHGSNREDVSVASSRTALAPVDQSVDEAIHIAEESLHERAALCDSGLPDPDMCLIPEAEEEPPKELPVWDEALTRGRWLLGLLVLQSTSSFVLDSYQELLRDHLVVTLFLTMLVGAGGNAGNQSAIRVIRGLATGSITTSWKSMKATVTEQLEVALLLGGGLAAAGFVRVYVTNGSLLNASAISLSLLAIVTASVLLGTGLPFALARLGLDPANAGTSIQVVMDILGVGITCFTCQAVLVQYAGSLGVS